MQADVRVNLDAGAAGHAAVGETLLPVIACLDLDQAMRRMGGNMKLVRKMIGRFAETQAGVAARIRRAMDSNDLLTLTREVHTTKGLAGNIGASHLLALSGEVETVFKHMAALPSALASWEQELGRVIAQISEAMATPPEPATPASATLAMLDRDALTKQLQELATLLENNDTRAAKLAASMAETLHGFGQGEAGRQLDEHIANYEFDEAMAILRAIVLVLETRVQQG